MILLPAVALAAAPFSGVPVAPVTIETYQVRVATSEPSARPEIEIRTVDGAEEYRIRTPIDGFTITGFAGTEYTSRTEGQDGSVTRNMFAAQPDAAPAPFDRYGALTSYVVARARGGQLTLAATTLGGRAAWRAEVDLPANECAGLTPRRVRIWLARRTLLPLRVVERTRADQRVRLVTTYTYSRFNHRPPSAPFAPPPLGPAPLRINRGFLRTAPARASGPLPYIPRLPSVLPAGFELAVSGWARRSGVTGAEGSIASLPWLFAASYRNGLDRIDVTQRVSTKDWLDDPFGGECQPLTTEPVMINGIAATYGIGQNTVPHLYWRDGPLLYTVSGPYPRDDLVTIAASLRKLGS